MAAGNTYVALASTILGSNVSSVTLSSISSTYTDLVLVCNGQTSSNTFDVRFQVNGDTGANYSSTQLYGTGSAAASTRSSSQTSCVFWNSSLSNQTAIINIMNYANTTTYKTFLVRGANTSGNIDADVGLWRSTAAINSVTVLISSGSLSSGSTFTLYGIAAA